MVNPSFRLQALPCTLKLIEGSTDLKGDFTMGVLVGHFNILYEAFNNMTAAGMTTQTYITFNDIVAQWVEHLPCIPRIASSIPQCEHRFLEI